MYKNGPAFEFDPINVQTPADHALGTDSTLQGTGSGVCDDGDTSTWSCSSASKCNVATDAGAGCLKGSTLTYANGIGQLQVAQNSWQYRFFLSTALPLVNEPGIYTIELIAEKKDGGKKSGPEEDDDDDDEEGLCGKKSGKGGKKDKDSLAHSKIVILVGEAGDFPSSAEDCEDLKWVTYKLFQSESECVAFTEGIFE
jgi:hypothetical protein